ncbi:MBL fold metallo-hydrolase [Phototrophicus methaneseepsis]|uniref:MBL fold metallo-hydrolase n=1 Tax=Phototrophicus methaneseepsis TaxID=2710758 RepID=A0A7S8E5Q2_9CHLR|nr:MBL fold metallo-hydrolase [Phototrophicus methaneseepsis]QPC80859.1 MBL fold metallo-hydrolase [Phototrophicus methaneseepsis]
MTIEIKQATLGLASTNVYIVGDTETKEAVVIDPVDDADYIQQMAEDAGWTIKLILATHAHFDHVLASKPLKEATGAPFYIHKDCVEWLENLPTQGRLFGMSSLPEAATPDRLLTTETETIQVSEMLFHTLYTPGHAPGHLSFYMPEHNLVFSGDTLFAGSIGRTDLPGGDYEVLMHSIFGKLLPLGDETHVLAGHMQRTTIGRERHTNPFILDYADKI